MTPPADPGRSRRAAGGGGGTGTGHGRGGTGPGRAEPNRTQPSRAGGTLPALMDAREMALDFPACSSWFRAGCRCCRATLLLANQHQFFSGKLYVLLQ
ncbi:uncharacterized protein [Taeniopygia guttata]|uniref:uncharacterized protein isoform X2 n=1 Tax=Taeniopygia guttata TaxID=59729 RepID=UPI003BB854C6